MRVSTDAAGVVRSPWKLAAIAHSLPFTFGRKVQLEARIAGKRIPHRARHSWNRIVHMQGHREASAEAVAVWHYLNLEPKLRRQARRRLRRTYRRYPHARGLLASIASPIGMGNDGQKAYDLATRTWFGTVVGQVTALNKPWVDVTHPNFGATGNGVTDDTAAIQRAATYLLSIGGGILFFPAGTYIVSSSIVLGTKAHLLGVGRQVSILKAAAAFAGAGNRGVLDFQGPGASLLTDDQICHLGFDLTANADNSLIAIHQTSGTMQHTLLFDIWLDLSSGANHHNGIQLEALGNHATIPSFDVVSRDVYARNGNGTVLYYLNATAATSYYHGGVVENCHNLIDNTNAAGVLDDRVGILGNYPAAVGIALVEDCLVRGTFTTIETGVTSFRVNGVKYDCGTATYIRNLSIRDTFFTNRGTSAILGLCPVIGLLTGGTSQAQNILVDGVWARGSGAVVIRLNRAEALPWCVIKNVQMYNAVSDYCFEAYAANAAATDELFTLEDCTFHSQRAVSGVFPIGVLLTGAAGQGWSGIVKLDGIILSGSLTTGITNNRSEAGAVTATGWSSIYIRRVLAYPGIATPLDMVANSYSVQDSNPFIQALVPQGAAGIAVGASPFTYVNADRQPEMVYVDGGTVTTVIKSGGVTLFNFGAAAARCSVWLEPGENIQVTYTVAPTMTKDRR